MPKHRPLTGVILSLTLLIPARAENRSIDGTGNAPGDRGAANTPFIRLSPAAYGDGLGTLAGGTRPNARQLSNLICDQVVSEPNGRRGSDFIWQWGQFVDHDITFSPADSGEPALIPVEETFDLLYNPDFPFIPLTRTRHATDGSGVRQQVNAITAFIDASNVYGSDPVTAAALRTFSGGLMKTGPDGLLPFNTAGLPMDGAGTVPGVTSSDLRMAGDVRANEQPCLTALHTLFVHEHNRLAAEIATAQPNWNDEEIYQRARKIVGALMQSITYNEWLPAFLGSAAPDPATFTYDAAVDPSISNEFATALFRFGHTMISPELMLIHDDNVLEASAELMDSFFNPTAFNSVATHEYLLKGLACQLHQDVDPRVIFELRNALFGPPGSGGMDLAALNIQRGRDHGLADYNTVRAAYGLPPKTSWSALSGDPFVQADFAAMYSNLSDLDPWPAALAEDRLPDAAVGETVAVAIAAEFTRLARGDRFFYLWDDELSPALRDEITHTSLSSIIGRNTSLNLQDNVFFIPSHQLGFHAVTHLPGEGVRLSFLGEPGFEYRIRFGSTPADLARDLIAEPLDSGDAAYMLQHTDSGAPAGHRFYQLVRTPVGP